MKKFETWLVFFRILKTTDYSYQSWFPNQLLQAKPHLGVIRFPVSNSNLTLGGGKKSKNWRKENDEKKKKKK